MFLGTKLFGGEGSRYSVQVDSERKNMGSLASPAPSPPSPACQMYLNSSAVTARLVSSSWWESARVTTHDVCRIVFITVRGILVAPATSVTVMSELISSYLSGGRDRL